VPALMPGTGPPRRPAPRPGQPPCRWPSLVGPSGAWEPPVALPTRPPVTGVAHAALSRFALCVADTSLGGAVDPAGGWYG
jgi:hypothetical protein